MIFNFQNHQDAAEFIASFLKGSVNRYKKVGLVTRTEPGLAHVLDAVVRRVTEAAYTPSVSSVRGTSASNWVRAEVRTPAVDVVGMVAGDGVAVHAEDFHWIVFVDRDNLPPAAVETILAGRQ